ncbi:MAG TPA: pyridoxal phosphate-dependent aminotransferase [Anaerolineae bacterium]|nr:pyridoxal phosphate-dependent aminotransferase [Anaerolineae bacterium]
MSAETAFARPLARRNEIWREYPLLTPHAQEHGEIIDLACAYLTEPVPAHIVQAAHDALDRGQTHYVDRLGIKPLREAIAATLAQEGNGNLTPDHILVTSGAQEALFVTFRSRMKPGDEILVPDPGYPLMHPIAELAGGVVVPVSSAADGFAFKASRYADAITQRTRFILLLSPNPATCQLIAPQELDRILQLAEQHQLVVILDAALSKGIFQGSTSKTFSNGLPERLILISSLSKFYRMSGWRIGWIAGSDAFLSPLRDLKQALSICSASISQWAAVAALTGPQDWLSEQQAAFANLRDLTTHALNAMGLTSIPSDAAFSLFVDIRRTGLTSQSFTNLALNQARVRVTPGTEYGAAGEGFVRISYASPPAQIETALNRLQHALSHI